MTLRIMALAFITVSATQLLFSQSGRPYDLSWNSIDQCGGALSSGGAYSLETSIGQFDAGPTMAGISYSFTGGMLSPYQSGPVLAVELNSFTAHCDGIGFPVELTWETAAEFENAGFHIYRAEYDEFFGFSKGERLSTHLIPARGTPAQGAVYTFTDPLTVTEPGELRAYYLEDIDHSGVATVHGPAVAAVEERRTSIEHWNLY